VWDPVTGEELYAFNEGDVLLDASTSAVVDLSPSGDRIAASRSDGGITVLDAASGDEILTLSGHGGQILSAAWSPGGDRLVTAGRDSYVRVWDVSPRARVLVGHAGAISGVDWSPSGDRLATASRDGTTRIWDAVTGEELLVTGEEILVPGEELLVPGEEIYGATSAAEVWPVSWSPSGDRIGRATAQSARKSAIQVWDASASSPTFGKELLALSGYKANDFSWSPQEDRFVTSASNGLATIWDASASSPTFGQQLVMFRGHSQDPVTSADWSPDGERIVTSGAGDYALVWDPDTRDVLLRLQAEPAEGLMRVAAWSPDGKRIATYSPRVGRVWDATTGEPLLTFAGHTGTVVSIVWSATGDRLLTASDDETARIWDARSGGELLSFSFNWPLGGAVWSPDMAHIAFGLGDGTVRIVDVRWHTTEELMAYARECCLIRELTPDEREQFGLPPR
jgi:WD40 repeat protein